MTYLILAILVTGLVMLLYFGRLLARATYNFAAIGNDGYLHPQLRRNYIKKAVITLRLYVLLVLFSLSLITYSTYLILTHIL